MVFLTNYHNFNLEIASVLICLNYYLNDFNILNFNFWDY